MSHLREFHKLVPLLACLFVWQPQVRAEICNRVVAVVNNEIITLYELNSRLKELTGLEPAVLRMKDEKGYLNARRRVLDLLIDERIATEKIQELGIKVTQKEVDSAIERIKQENSLTHEDLLHSLEAKGLTYETYQENIKKDLERMRLINFEVKSKIIIRE
jgi:peptidyl-prolyl cis-trans isomerase SurA